MELGKVSTVTWWNFLPPQVKTVNELLVFLKQNRCAFCAGEFNLLMPPPNLFWEHYGRSVQWTDTVELSAERSNGSMPKK